MWWLLAYMAVATGGLFVAMAYLHERAEQAVWRTLLATEMDYIVDRLRADPGFRWQDSDTLRLYRRDGDSAMPDALWHSAPGLVDEVEVAGRKSAVLVRDHDQLGRLALALDITDFEAIERLVVSWSAIVAAVLFLVTVLLAWFASRRLFAPLRRLAEDIQRLQPEAMQQRVDVEANGSSELVVIANALNGYLSRHAQFVERERVFIDTASHELRTPMAVITGATELALHQAGLPEAAREQVLRARRTARDVEQLISLLLVLAKDPGKLAKSNDCIALDELIPEIVEDHRYLAQGKNLRIDCDGLARCEVMAPVAIAQAAIGNLLRNAIENSDQGLIRISLDADATVTIDDPGHGMTPEEVARIYTQLARSNGRSGGGIGLDLITRLCEHLGWRLSIASTPGQGTRAVLAIRSPPS